MPGRILVLYNDDGSLARGSAEDRAAVESIDATAEAVADACRESGFDVALRPAPIDVGQLQELLDRETPMAVFNLVEALRGEARLEAAAAWVFELCQVAYTGSPPEALSLALNKPVTQAVLRGQGIAVPASRILTNGDEPLDGLRFPVIVKPSCEDASHGIAIESVCRNHVDAVARSRWIIATYDQPAIVEEFIDGREFNVSILGAGPSAEVLPLREIDFSGFPTGVPRLVTYAAKWLEASPEYKGTVGKAAGTLAPAVRRAIESTAIDAYRAIGLRDYGRIDIRIDDLGRPFVLDVNANPDITPGAGLASTAALAGLSYRELIARIATSAVHRCPVLAEKAATARACRGALVTSPPRPEPRTDRASFARAADGSTARCRPLTASDREPLARLLGMTGVFTEGEVNVALDLIDEGVDPEGDPDYRFAVASTAAIDVAGYVCFGPTPLSDGVFDIYWIAVNPECQRQGVGQALLQFAEQSARDAGARLMLIETGGKTSYAGTRSFYERAGYEILARIPDFFRLGDDKLIYNRSLV